MYNLDGKDVDPNDKKTVLYCARLVFFYQRNHSFYKEYVRDGGKLSYRAWRDAIACRLCLANKEHLVYDEDNLEYPEENLENTLRWLRKFDPDLNPNLTLERTKACSTCKALEEDNEATALRIARLEDDLLYN